MNDGLIVTFYSYKGGVGRTFILANIGAMLSIWGYRVLCVDWDLEAPGLGYYFRPWNRRVNKPGLLELVEAYARGSHPSWHKHITSFKFPEAKQRLSFMSAGVLQDDSYAHRVQEMDWQYLYEEKDLGAFLEDLREEWKEKYDFVLIDSRTGITDIGGVCTVQMPDVLAFVFIANHQSLDGAIDVVRRAMEQRKHLPQDRSGFLTLPIASRFDMREEYKEAAKWLETFENKLGRFYFNWANKDVPIADLVGFTRVPYFSYWSFGERLPVVEETRKDSDSISYPLQTLAALIAHHLSETSLLVQNRDSFVNTARRGAAGRVDVRDEARFDYDVFLSYSQQDAGFAARLRDALNEQGLRTFLVADDISGGAALLEVVEGAMQRARHMVAIYGDEPSRWQLEETNVFMSLILREEQDRRLIPVRISTTPTIPVVAKQLQYVDATDMRLEEVAEKIVDAIE